LQFRKVLFTACNHVANYNHYCFTFYIIQVS